ncbi:MAG TPA: metallophosphoesterase family protein [Streptosporangiaceae bacterium]|nr:metallophosphoesterase family protein [Streptosporangiaceae bacterium]
MPLLRRRAKKEVVRLYVVSDFHASAPAWRKMLNAVRMNLYKADAVLYAGDLTGKAIVPVVEGDQSWEAELLGQKRRPRTQQELQDLDRDIAALGYYPYHTTRAEVDALHGDPAALNELFARQIRSQVADWMQVAADRLEGNEVPVYLIPGNDDPYEIDEPLNASERAINVDRRVAELPGGLEVIGLGLSSPTPWSTPREVSEHDFREAIFSLADKVKDPRRTILLTHCPPHDSGLDIAPMLDDNMRPIVSAGDLLRGPVGSTGVREAIEQFGPLLSLHGHIHESAGEAKIGQTLCLNPGSEAAYGIVRGYLIDISTDGIERSFRVEG